MDECNKINLVHYLLSVYLVTIRLHVSILLVAHHQEVTMYICNNWYLYVLVDCRRAWLEFDSKQTRIYLVSLHTYIEMHGQQNIKVCKME
jgi:hypothetical protein